MQTSPQNNDLAESGDLGVDLLAALNGGAHAPSGKENRVRERFPIYGKMQVTPISPSGQLDSDATVTVFGKDLSVRGICFSHDMPLPSPRIVLSLVHPEIGQLVVEAEISWTRETPIGLFESGCRLIRKIVWRKPR